MNLIEGIIQTFLVCVHMLSNKSDYDITQSCSHYSGPSEMNVDANKLQILKH